MIESCTCHQSMVAEARRAAEGSYVHLLDSDGLVIDGVRFLGATLWTDFALAIDAPEERVSDVPWAMKQAASVLNDYTLTRTFDETSEPGKVRDQQSRKLQAADTLRIHQAQRAWLQAKLAEPFDCRTVVVTHHAPHRGSLSAQYADDWVSGAFVSELPDDFFEVPVLWVHGHTHQSFNYRVRGCRVVCNPRGYVSRMSGRIENQAFDPGLMVEVPTSGKGGGSA